MAVASTAKPAGSGVTTPPAKPVEKTPEPPVDLGMETTPPDTPAEDPATDSAEAKGKEPRNFGETKIQQETEVTVGLDEVVMEAFLDIETTRPITGKPDAFAYLRESGLSGRFRVIQIKGIVASETVTVTKLAEEG